MGKQYVFTARDKDLATKSEKDLKALVGGKGAGLFQMTSFGIPVPSFFNVSTEACMEYIKNGRKIPKEIEEQIDDALGYIEGLNQKKLGDPKDPLLVSVRSGARVSMPGMMDTVLNLGLNDESAKGLAAKTGNERFVYDSYRRFIQMFSDVVMGISKAYFERVIDEYKEKQGKHLDTELTAEDWKKMVEEFKAIYKREKGEDFPQSPKVQLIEAIQAVFRSWENDRAVVYRRMYDIPSDWGTAVNVQTMVFGNKGDTSGTGVAFTRNPATGEKGIFGEYLINAQGEDVVAGIRTPKTIKELEKDMPEAYKEFMDIANKLESSYKDMQDMEFTIEEGKLYFLQTRNGKRTAHAALKIATDLVAEGLLTENEAVMKVDPRQLDQLLHPNFDQKSLAAAKVIGSALPASPGAATGKVYFTAQDAKNAADKGENVILVRLETSPEDIEGMNAAEGILTARGGMTSHAAVVARGMGTCCVSGCGELKIDEEKREFTLSGKTYKEGDYISLDGSTGKIYGEQIKTVEPEISGDFAKFMGWADKVRVLKVRTNADTPHDAENAIAFGAEGIGLCRTEHMFFEEDRIFRVRQMILSETKEQREEALGHILPFQKKDFIGIFEAMEEKPVTIRLLDPPLHEFLPHTDEELKALAKEMKVDFERLKAKAEDLKEFNPMMGHRGCRLDVSYPEIAVMQARAIIEAAIEVKKSKGYNIVPEIMIPLICELKELKFVKELIVKTADELIKASGTELKYMVGTMIEIPRAALLADEIAKEAEFFSFGTNDLTQMTFGFSRDDAGKFLNDYYEAKVFESDPFAKLDQEGVGQLVQMAVEKGRKTRENIKLGICGEHGGDPTSIEFCHQVGLNYVSCSPFRVPIARLAAAQAALSFPRK